jgi:hypothetical protein
MAYKSLFGQTRVRIIALIKRSSNIINNVGEVFSFI